MVVMSIHKFVLIVFWAIIWTWVPSMASTIPGNPAIRMALGVVGYLMNLRTIFSENKLRMVQDMALDTEDWETPISSPLHNCIFPVAINLKINKTFSRDVKAWFLIEPEEISFVVNPASKFTPLESSLNFITNPNIQ